MSLQAALDESIVKYPTLYRRGDRDHSELHVLSHYFISYGTGLEWHPHGLLADYNHRRGYAFPKRVRMPDDFFEAELYALDVDPRKSREIIAELGDRFYLRKPGRTCFGKTVGLLVRLESKEQAIQDVIKYSADPADAERAEWMADLLEKLPPEVGNIGVHVSIARGDKLDDEPGMAFEDVWFPDSISEYSPICEMLEGRTNSPHIENFDLDGIIRPDWVDGAVRIARMALKQLTDESKHPISFYYPAPENLHGWHRQEGETDEELLERAQRTFAKMVEQHTDIVMRFLQKFD